MGFLSGKLRSKPERKLSEPTYETPKYGEQSVARHYAQHQPSKFGPHFQKGPAQEEIYDRRANGERMLPGHPDLRDRAHSFHQPRQHHAYSDPFETRPPKWSNQMDAEYKQYHSSGDNKTPQNVQNEAYMTTAHRLPVGDKHPFNPAHGPILQTGIAAARAEVMKQNHVVQGREGFVQKYPQSYKDEKALETHNTEVKNRRQAAANRRGQEDTLQRKYAIWTRRQN
ncbi:hypothetical protein N7519_004979 [Penicillium mononematosum]|uniref:uncharacterized protein n=1 Tax=Penicillium mononematosum TaxID=268346 RepID=UPI002546EFF0|nr:uncharacterized protein N7519_004979 [Penicillium mononematosum]KAJ6183678.1 hypothetical protein N7519_004979 [Penicillium mononematosum]